MPLSEKGKTVLASMKEHYGEKKGKRVFYASESKGTITGIKKRSNQVAAIKKKMSTT